jgi:hypothetical protein
VTSRYALAQGLGLLDEQGRVWLGLLDDPGCVSVGVRRVARSEGRAERVSRRRGVVGASRYALAQGLGLLDEQKGLGLGLLDEDGASPLVFVE